jgi:hypothetical protein
MEVPVRTAKFEFMSPQWIAMARDEITRALSGKDLGPRRFTVCEAFTDPPEHLRRPDSARVGFCIRLDGTEVSVSDRLAEDADCTVVSDYGEALAIARDPESPSADPAVMAERVADGRLTIEGDFSAAPSVLQEVNIHKLLASRTA